MTDHPFPLAAERRSPGEVARDHRQGIEVWGSFGLSEVQMDGELRRYLAADAPEASIQITGHEGTLQQTQIANPRPTLGRVVHVLVHPSLNNGADVASAVVTRVWSQAADGAWLVNLRVWLDGTNTTHEWATSRHLHATEELARAKHTRQLELQHDLDGLRVVGVGMHAFWPPRS